MREKDQEEMQKTDDLQGRNPEQGTESNGTAYSAEELQGDLEPYAEEELEEAGEQPETENPARTKAANLVRENPAEYEQVSMNAEGNAGSVKKTEQEGKSAKKREPNAQESGPAEKQEKKKKRGIGWLIPVILAVVFVVSFASFLKQFLTYQQAKNEYHLLDQYMEAVPEEKDTVSANENAETGDGGASEEAAPTVEYPKLQIDFDALKKTNPEFNSVIYLPVLDLKYPVAQADSNDKYLNTTFEGTRNASGCIFLDTVASPDFSDRNTFIFGHNMKNQTMFGCLKKFLQEKDLCDQDPYIYIYQENQVLVYRIFAYYTIPVRDDVYDDFFDDAGYDAYVADAQKHSVYQPEENEIDWESRPDLLTLSTCYATGHVSNFIVQGALIGKAPLSD